MFDCAKEGSEMCELISLLCSFFLVFPSRLSVTFDIQISLKMKHSYLTFGSQFRNILEPCQTSKINVFSKIIKAFIF